MMCSICNQAEDAPAHLLWLTLVENGEPIYLPSLINHPFTPAEAA